MCSFHINLRPSPLFALVTTVLSHQMIYSFQKTNSTLARATLQQPSAPLLSSRRWRPSATAASPTRAVLAGPCSKSHHLRRCSFCSSSLSSWWSVSLCLASSVMRCRLQQWQRQKVKQQRQKLGPAGIATPGLPPYSSLRDSCAGPEVEKREGHASCRAYGG